MARSRVRRLSPLPERLITQLWQNQLRDRADLVTEDGEPVQIIYPGRVNGDQGADLLDTVIAISQELKRGDIEFHVKSSDWWAHGHHRDPAYNRVILHVVLWHDTEAAARLQNGEGIPTLALDKYLKNADSVYPPFCSNLPCRQASEHRDIGLLGAFLDSAGRERFLAKADRFQADLDHTEAGQSLYQAIMVALGYAKNKAPFRELAHRLPLQTLESITKSEAPEAECLAQQQALLLGTAGLLPSQCPGCSPTAKGEDWVDKIEGLWAATQRVGTMSERDWHFSKVRPNNFPTRRMAAMSYLVLRYRERGMLDELVSRLREMPAACGNQGLERLLMVTADGYWATHLDSFLPSRQRIPTLLGSRRAAEIVVNVILPFAFAWSRCTFQPELARKSLGIYQRYPRLAVNAVERHMSHQLGLNSDLVDSAQRQQGLIHIYQTLCSQGKCYYCPISRWGD